MKLTRIILAMLTAGIILSVTAFAQSTHFSAFYTDNSVTVDGTADAAVYVQSADFSDGASRMGISYDDSYVYVMASLGKTYEKFEMKIGDGTKVVYKIADGTFENGAGQSFGVTANGNFELKLSYDDLGISFVPGDISRAVSASLIAGDTSASISETTVDFRYGSPIFYDSCDDFTAAAYGNQEGNVKPEKVSIGQKQNSSSYNFTITDTSVSCLRNITRNLYGYTVGDAAFEMNLTINNLPIIDTPKLNAWRGFVFEVQNTVRRRLSLTADANGNILLNVLYHDASDANGNSVSVISGKKIGDSFKLRGEFNKDNDLAVYIDDTLVHTFESIDMKATDKWYYILSAVHYNVKSGKVDVDMHDFAFYVPEPVLPTLTAESILGANASADSISSDLALYNTIGLNGKTYNVTWSSSDDDIISDDGMLNRSPENAGKTVTMTANVAFGSDVITREFQFTLSNALSAPYLSSYYTEASITVDGNPSESVLLYNGEFVGSDAVLGASWNTEGYAVALRHGTVTPSTLTLRLGNKSFVYDIANGALTESIEGVSAKNGDGVTEMFIPYAAAGLEFSAVERAIPLDAALKIGESTYRTKEGYLSNVCAILTSVDNCDSFTGYGSYSNLGDHANIVRTDVNSGYNFKYTGTSTAIKGFGKNTGGVVTAPFDIELSVTINDLPVIKTVDLRGWRGLSLDLSDAKRGRFSLTADTDGSIIFSTLYGTGTGTSKCLDTGKKLGDSFTWRVSADAEYGITLYIDGRKVGTLPAVDFTAAYNHTYLEIDLANYDSISGGIDVRIEDVIVARKIAVLEKITFDDIKGSNVSADAVYSNLELVKTATFGNTGIEVPLVWKSSNPEYISDNGELTYSTESVGKSAVMTVTATSGGASVSRDFEISFDFETVDKELYYAFSDKNPYTGKLNSTTVNFDFPFDVTENSVGLDLGSVKTINTVTIIDSDDTSKMHRNDVSLYVSDDNETYTRIKDFDLFRTENKLIFAGFETEARFVKVHCHISVNEFISFKNKLKDIIKAEYNENLVAGGDGAFEKIGSIRVKSASDISDGTAYVSFADMGIDTAKLCEDMRDLRFAVGDRVVNHYIEGDGAYIRIPDAVKNTAVTVDIYGNNPNAESISDSGSVFEIIYGNRTLTDMTDPENGFNHCITTARCPNGDLIAVGAEGIVKARMTMRRSTDGGRTWGETTEFWNNGPHADGCGFLVDGDRMFCIFHISPPGVDYYTLQVAIIMSDDNGYTWKNPDTGVVNSAYFPPTGKYYTVTYTEGIKLSTYDGEGDGIDYVFMYEMCSDNTYSDFAATSLYSRDNGKTWQTSESEIRFNPGNEEDASGKHETGVSECSVVELSDGRLKIYARVQYDDNILLGESTSYDHGVTWEENCTLTEIYSSNTFPVMKTYKDSVLLLWGGNNMMGGRSYFRCPINLAYSLDDMETWNAKHDVLSGTSEGDVSKGSYLCVQPKMIFNEYNGSEDMHLAWWKWRTNSNYGMLVEDASDYIFKTKGAADSFETVSSLYEGWSTIDGYATISDAKATDGRYSMKIDDAAGKVARVSRSIPELYSGEISFDINLEKYSSWMYVELKGALSFEHYTGNKLAFSVNKDGQLFAVNNKTKSAAGNALAVLELDKWYNIKVTFDIEAETADIYVNGTRVGSLPVNNDVFGGISIVQIADASASLPAGLTAYVDNFRAYEGTSFELCEEEETKSVEISITLSREDGSKPHNTAEYSNFAKLSIYTDSTKETLVGTVVLENENDDSAEIKASTALEIGTYYAEIVKNGYLTYKTTFEVTDSGAKLPDIKLTAGDVKASYEDECGDGVVDIDDFVRVLRGFSSDSEKLTYTVDINEDGVVNVSDIALVKANLGKKS